MIDRGFDARSNRGKLIDRATGREFNQNHAERITGHFNNILKPEILLSQQQPDLWTLPVTAKPVLPQFDLDTNEEVFKQWDKFSSRYADPNRFMTPIAKSSEDHGLTWLKFDTHLEEFKKGNWLLYAIYINGIHLPLNVENNPNPKIKTKPSILSEEDADKLSLALVEAMGESVSDSDIASVKREKGRRQSEESLALNMLINSPEQFLQFFPVDKLKQSPDRLMTEDEMSQWNVMLQKLFSTGNEERVVVGKKGYGSYQEYRALWNFGFENPILEIKSLNPDGTQSSATTTHYPVQIKNSQTTHGWTILNISRYPSHPKPAVNFSHGNRDTFWFDLWEQKQQA